MSLHYSYYKHPYSEGQLFLVAENTNPYRHTDALRPARKNTGKMLVSHSTFFVRPSCSQLSLSPPREIHIRGSREKIGKPEKDKNELVRHTTTFVKHDQLSCLTPRDARPCPEPSRRTGLFSPIHCLSAGVQTKIACSTCHRHTMVFFTLYAVKPRSHPDFFFVCNDRPSTTCLSLMSLMKSSRYNFHPFDLCI